MYVTFDYERITKDRFMSIKLISKLILFLLGTLLDAYYNINMHSIINNNYNHK